MARNLSWIDKRRLSALLDDTGTAREPEELAPPVPEPPPAPARFHERAPSPPQAVPEPPPALFAEAIDALNIEAFATSGPSSFDLPKADQETHSREPADPVVDDALQFSPFETGTNAPVSESEPPAWANAEKENPADFFPSAEELPPPIKTIDLNDEELTAVWDQQVQQDPKLWHPPPGGAEAKANLAVPEVTESLRTRAEPEAEANFAVPTMTLPPDRTQETPSGGHDEGLALGTLGTPSAGLPDDILAQARQRLTPHLPAPPFVDEEPVELTAERFFDWALDLSGLDGVLVVDRHGLPIAERGFHELPPPLLVEVASLGRGVERYLDARDCGAIQFRHQRLAVVLLWARASGKNDGRAIFAGLSGLAEPNPGVDALADGFRALFFGPPPLGAASP